MKWHAPPEEIGDAFVRLQETFYGRRPLPLPANCAICGRERSCHVYYHRHKEGQDLGGGWIWCSACHSYEHFSMRVPDW